MTKIGEPTTDAPRTIPMPCTDVEFDAVVAQGYLPAIPPQDYTGSIAAWCVAMAEIGLSDNYSELCSSMIRSDIYDQILEECEGRR
jgi:hypothetical protein